MTITALGEVSVGGAVPGCATAVVAGELGINAAMPDILARLAALASFVPLPIDFVADLALAGQIGASIQAGITAGLPVPDMSAQAAVVQALITALLAQVTSINLQLDALLALDAPLGVAGVALYAFDGARTSLGSELAAELGPVTAHANALVLVTSDPAAWLAISAVMKVS